MGLLSALELPPVERDRRLAQMEQEWKNEEALAERLQVRRGAMATLLEDVLSEQLQAEMNESPAAPDGCKEDLRRFKAWCTENELQPLPSAPECVAFFLIEAGESYQRAVRMAGAIGYAHRVNQHDDPTSDILVRAALRYLKEKPKRATNGANGHTELNPNLKGLN